MPRPNLVRSQQPSDDESGWRTPRSVLGGRYAGGGSHSDSEEGGRGRVFKSGYYSDGGESRIKMAMVEEEKHDDELDTLSE